MGPGRVELPTLRLSGARSNQLSYEPKTDIEVGFVKAVVRTQLKLIIRIFKEPRLRHYFDAAGKKISLLLTDSDI